MGPIAICEPFLWNCNSSGLRRCPHNLYNPISSGLLRSCSDIKGSDEFRRGLNFRCEGSAAFSHQCSKISVCFPFSRGDSLLRNQRFSCRVEINDKTLNPELLTEDETEEQELRDYEEAVQEKDFLEVLDALNSFESDSVGLRSEEGLASSTSGRNSLREVNRFEDLRILDTFAIASDLGQVGKAYEWLAKKGSMPNFGKVNEISSEGQRPVTEAILKDSIGLGASELAPKKWGFSGQSVVVLPIGLALFSWIRDSGFDVRPVGFLILGFLFYDASQLGGTSLLQIFSMWLPYRKRVLVHEAGHVLVAYLLGCPIRGVILDPIQAVKMGIKGQAGTQFWDQTLEMELAEGKLSDLAVDKYSIVVYAGMAAEALVYREVRGGESDENLFKLIVSQLQPAWSPAKISDQARWAVIQAFQLLRKHKKAHAAVVEALEEDSSLGSLIRAIEEAMA